MPVRLVTLAKCTVSKARNAGLEVVEATVIVFLDDDVVPSVHFLAEHAKFHQDFAAPEAALLGYVAWQPEVHMTLSCAGTVNIECFLDIPRFEDLPSSECRTDEREVSGDVHASGGNATGKTFESLIPVPGNSVF